MKSRACDRSLPHLGDKDVGGADAASVALTLMSPSEFEQGKGGAILQNPAAAPRLGDGAYFWVYRGHDPTLFVLKGEKAFELHVQNKQSWASQPGSLQRAESTEIGLAKLVLQRL